MHLTRKILIVMSLLTLGFDTVYGQALAPPPYIAGNPFTDVLFGNPFTDLGFLGAGARAHAMGGAFYAVSDDASAISWNPAGLIEMDKEQMALSFHHTSAKNDYSGSFASGGTIPFGGDISQGVDQLAYAAVVLPFEFKGREFVGSASIPNTVSEMRGVDFRDTLGLTHEINGRLSKASLGLATRINSKISAGLAVNIYGHGYDRNGLVSFQLSPPPDDTLQIYHPKVKSSFSGWNVTIGGMLKANKLRAAVVFKSPFTKGSPLKENMDIRVVSDIVVNGVANPGGAPAGILFKTKREWILPAILGFGVAYQLSDNLLLAADYDYNPMSKAWVKVQNDLINPSSGFEALDLDWYNIHQIRLGGEYKFTINRFTIPVRAGYRNDPKVFGSTDENALFLASGSLWDFSSGTAVIAHPGTGSQVKGSVISFGSGIAFGQVNFDVSWEFSNYDWEERGLQQSDQFEMVPFYRKSEASNNRFIFNFTGIF